MARLSFTRRYLTLRRTQEELLRELASMQSENGRLRESLIVAQDARQAAQRQAEELRKEKERLRGRVTALKKELDATTRIQEQLHEKIAALREANEILRGG